MGYDEPERTQRLRVSTRLDAGELTAPDMETLLTNPTVPLRFSALKIFALPSDDKNVTLSLSDAANTLEVSGASRIWVLGQREQIKEFVTQRKPRYAFVFRPSDSKRLAVLSLFALCAFALLGFLVSIANASKSGALFFGGALAAYVILLAIILVLPYSRLSRTTAQRRRLGDDVVAIGTVFLVLLTFIGTLSIISQGVSSVLTWLTHLRW